MDGHGLTQQQQQQQPDITSPNGIGWNGNAPFLGAEGGGDGVDGAFASTMAAMGEKIERSMLVRVHARETARTLSGEQREINLHVHRPTVGLPLSKTIGEAGWIGSRETRGFDLESSISLSAFDYRTRIETTLLINLVSG